MLGFGGRLRLGCRWGRSADLVVLMSLVDRLLGQVLRVTVTMVLLGIDRLLGIRRRGAEGCASGLYTSKLAHDLIFSFCLELPRT